MAGTLPDRVGDLCPECGSPLEPVAQLAEIVGFRAIKSRDAERWADDGGSFRADAVALPRPETQL
jgi:hypothetical protein